jgi:hypothetical protein
VRYLREDKGGGTAFSIRVKKGAKLFSIRTERYHLFWDGNTDQTYFFDLDADPEERRNLAPSGTAVEKQLTGRLFDWISEYETAEPRPAKTGPGAANRAAALGGGPVPEEIQEGLQDFVRRASERPMVIDRALQEQLRALGYLQEEDELPSDEPPEPETPAQP